MKHFAAKRLRFLYRNGEEFQYGGRAYWLSHDECSNLRNALTLTFAAQQQYIVSEKKREKTNHDFIRSLQLSSLKIWEEFDRICKKCGLTYFIIGGTLLGAYRHGGFIPWDDDLDVTMPKEHYDEIVKAYNTHNTLPGTEAKLVSPSRGVLFTKIEVKEEPLAFIDIFPCECFAESLEEIPTSHVNRLYKEHHRKLHTRNTDLLKAYYQNYRERLGLTPVRHNSEECKTLINFTESNGFRSPIESQKVFPLQTIRFENFNLPAPSNIRYYLRACRQIRLLCLSHFSWSKTEAYSLSWQFSLCFLP